ncbi:MAG: histidine--tRNA ligase [Candidatus Omnitrophica bacterium]|nr:histidine--tRNA ligase [Candidatus Omnitrophota bacterium]
MVKKISGTKDILPQEINLWQRVEEAARKVFFSYNYSEIRTPIIEEESLFNRSLGKTAEIVKKQMFLIKAGKDVYALRPEGTASIVRAYIENDLDKKSKFVKFYYIGPMFRFERPQRGRLRQFHHIGAEAIGSTVSALDVEIISLADSLLNAFQITDHKLKINSLGCNKDQNGLRQLLHKQLKYKLNKLCDECKQRYKKNILRILDCKNPSCIEICQKLNIGDSNLCFECKKHFADVLEGLDSLNIKYEVTPYLVRGLDYYTRTVFEISHSSLGAQDALCAGGRYDNLVKELGGPDIGAIGFALGVERLLLVYRSSGLPVFNQKLSYIITLGKEAKLKGIKLLNDLRRAGIPCDTDYEDRSLKGAMRAANDLGVRYVLIIGEDELNKGVVTIKDMQTGEQREVKREDLLTNLM